MRKQQQHQTQLQGSREGGGGESPTAAAAAGAPNVVLVVVDDLGWSDVGFHEPTFFTPTIDIMASEGINLDSFYVAPTCTPSRTQLMTGRYNYRIGMQDSVVHSTEPRGVPLQERFLSQKLQQAGYTTAAIGKWHLGMHMPQYTPLRRGFDKHYGILTGGGDHCLHISASQTFTARHSTTTRQFTGFNLWEDGAVSDDNDNPMHTTDLYADKALEYVREFSTQDNPFFMYLAFQAVHDPIQAPDHWYQDTKCADIPNVDHSSTPDIDWDNRLILCGMMAQLDHALFQLRSELEQQGVWDNTVVFFLSDNGGIHTHGSSNQPLNGQKGTYLEGGVRVPAFVAGGYVQQALADSAVGAHTYTDMVHITDVHATILRLAGYTGQPNESPLDGVDQWQAWLGETSTPARDTMVINLNSAFFAGSGAVRVGDYKLIRNSDPKESTLYAQVKTRLKNAGATIDEQTLLELAQQASESLGLSEPEMLLFDIRQNPYELTDGNCTIPAACSNLFSSPDYADVRASLEAFFGEEASSMTPATFKWEDDGPLADPSNFGGVWSPWRDFMGDPLAIYEGVTVDAQSAASAVTGITKLAAQRPVAGVRSNPMAMSVVPQRSAIFATVSSAFVAATLLALLFYRAGRRSVYRSL